MSITKGFDHITNKQLADLLGSAGTDANRYHGMTQPWPNNYQVRELVRERLYATEAVTAATQHPLSLSFDSYVDIDVSFYQNRDVNLENVIKQHVILYGILLKRPIEQLIKEVMDFLTICSVNKPASRSPHYLTIAHTLDLPHPEHTIKVSDHNDWCIRQAPNLHMIFKISPGGNLRECDHQKPSIDGFDYDIHFRVPFDNEEYIATYVDANEGLVLHFTQAVEGITFKYIYNRLGAFLHKEVVDQLPE